MAHCDNANHEDEASLDDDDDDNGEDNGGTVPAKAINVNIVGVVLSVVCRDPVLQTVAHLLVLLILSIVNFEYLITIIEYFSS